jgi:glycosyltransferase involved in cell wall biosynthesis
VKNAVRSWAPDVVHLDGLRLAPLAGQLSVPAVLVCREPGVRHAREARHLAGGLLAWVGAGLQECREASWARRWLPAARLCIVPCEADRRALARYLPFEQLEVVPPGIDTELYGVRRGSRRPRLVFAGTLARPGHAQAAWRLATRVLPGVRRALPSAELLVADAGSAPTLRALAALPGVRVSSATPDLRPTLWTAATVLVPAEAGPGVEAALLEAMALGTPVVSAHAGLDGLDHVLPGRHVLVAESDAEMTDAALLLMREPVVATTLAAGARQVVERRYTHAAASQCYEALWARAAEAAPRAVAA